MLTDEELLQRIRSRTADAINEEPVDEPLEEVSQEQPSVEEPDYVDPEEVAEAAAEERERELQERERIIKERERRAREQQPRREPLRKGNPIRGKPRTVPLRKTNPIRGKPAVHVPVMKKSPIKRNAPFPQQRVLRQQPSRGLSNFGMSGWNLMGTTTKKPAPSNKRSNILQDELGFLSAPTKRGTAVKSRGIMNFMTQPVVKKQGKRAGNMLDDMFGFMNKKPQIKKNRGFF
jgi:hypothetical protein